MLKQIISSVTKSSVFSIIFFILSSSFFIPSSFFISSFLLHFSSMTLFFSFSYHFPFLYSSLLSSYLCIFPFLLISFFSLASIPHCNRVIVSVFFAIIHELSIINSSILFICGTFLFTVSVNLIMVSIRLKSATSFPVGFAFFISPSRSLLSCSAGCFSAFLFTLLNNIFLISPLWSFLYTKTLPSSLILISFTGSMLSMPGFIYLCYRS